MLNKCLAEEYAETFIMTNKTNWIEWVRELFSKALKYIENQRSAWQQPQQYVWHINYGITKEKVEEKAWA